MKDFFDQLRRRQVVRAALSYLVVAWLLLQLVNNIVTPLHLPDWTATLVVVLLAVGFPLALVVAWGTEAGVSRAAERSETGAARQRGFSFARSWDFAIIGALAVAVGYFMWERQASAPSTPRAVGEAVAPSVRQASIAVLPFVDMSPDKDQEYFSDGLSEELLNSLARIRDLQVAGRTSSFYFKGKNEDLRVIGETLGVNHILEGSVRKSGERLRITAQLINTATGYHLWSETYDRKLDDIFEVQDEIAMAVATALEVALGVGDLGRIPGMTRNAAAFEDYLQGTAQYLRLEPESLRRAIRHFERAIALDPAFSLAWVKLWEVYVEGGALVPEQAVEWQRKAEEALEKARDLTPEAPGVLRLVAEHHARRGEWRTAGGIFQKLVALAVESGGETMAWKDRARFLMFTGRTREAFEDSLRVRAADPLDSQMALFSGELNASAGHYDAALAEFERGVALDGPQPLLRGSGLLTALASGDRALIDKWLALSNSLDANGRSINVAMGKFLDDPAAAPAEIRRMAASRSVNENPLEFNILGLWAAYYNDPELSLELFRKIPRSGGNTTFINVSLWRPIMRDVRKLPGFKDFVRDIGLVAYWREFGWADYCRPVGDEDFACE